MLKIWKEPLPQLNSVQNSQYSFNLMLPNFSRGLHVAMQGKQACLWYECDPEEPKVEHTFYSIGTGHGTVPDPEDARYIGTVIDQVEMVWHVYQYTP